MPTRPTSMLRAALPGVALSAAMVLAGLGGAALVIDEPAREFSSPRAEATGVLDVRLAEPAVAPRQGGRRHGRASIAGLVAPPARAGLGASSSPPGPRARRPAAVRTAITGSRAAAPAPSRAVPAEPAGLRPVSAAGDPRRAGPGTTRTQPLARRRG